jgi:hypothetical protein
MIHNPGGNGQIQIKGGCRPGFEHGHGQFGLALGQDAMIRVLAKRRSAPARSMGSSLVSSIACDPAGAGFANAAP